jgi:DNA primase
MIDRFDIQKLQALPIEEVASALGLSVSHHKALCPFHADKHPSLTFSVRKNRYRCFVCDAHGGTIDLVMKYLNKNFLEACKWLSEEHSIPVMPVAEPVEAPKPFDASRYARFFARPWLSNEARKFLFEERRLDPRVVRYCQLTSWKDRQGVPWLQIPYYDRDGKLIGIQNRNLIKGATPRFRFPSGSACSIYNLPVLNLLKPGEPLFLTEGCSDCWSMLSAGHKAIAIPSATLLTKKDIEILGTLNLELGTPFHIFPDQDTAGEQLYYRLVEAAVKNSFTLVRHELPSGCKDFSEYYMLNVKS